MNVVLSLGFSATENSPGVPVSAVAFCVESIILSWKLIHIAYCDRQVRYILIHLN